MTGSEESFKRVRVRVDGRTVAVEGDRPLVIGRDPGCDIVIAQERASVSRRHAELVPTATGWLLRDLGSGNGTHVAGRPITELALREGSVQAQLGHPADGVRLDVEVATARSAVEVSAGGAGDHPQRDLPVGASRLGQLSAVYRLPSGRVGIGRAPDNEFVLDDLQVSRHHAELIPTPDGHFLLHDLRSHNGTLVNGRRIERVVLADGDLVRIGITLFRFRRGQLEEFVEAGAAWLCAMGLTYTTPDRHLILDGVSFALEPSSLLAIVGPSGSGKTTLVNALTGFRRVSSGRVIFGGRDVYASLDDLRQRMGFVPQEDLLHAELTVRQALRYAAELRFPPDVEEHVRRQRVEELMDELAISHRADLPIARLSGGQRKRTSVAVELLTKPGLLFLDEPTSGLDPANQEQVISLLRGLADGGRLVIVVTHEVQHLDRCDRVLFLAPGGRTAFFGPPAEARQYFKRLGHGDTYSSIFAALDAGQETDWSGHFTSDEIHSRYVLAPLTEAQKLAQEPGGQVHERVKARRLATSRQFAILTRRYLRILASDKRTVALMAVQAPLFALLFLLLFFNDVMEPISAPEATTLIWLLVVGATWVGTSNSVREIVKEAPILRRERSTGLSLAAYLGSKVLVLGTISLVQGALLALLATLPQSLPPGDVSVASRSVVIEGGALLGAARVELMLDLAVVGFAAMTVGLLVSAIVRSSDHAMVILPLVLVAQVVLSAPLFSSRSGSISAIVLNSAGVLSTASWGTAAAASTSGLNEIRRPYLEAVATARSLVSTGGLPQVVSEDPATWDHDSGTWLLDVVMLMALSGAFLGAAGLVLQRRRQ